MEQNDGYVKLCLPLVAYDR